MYIYMYNLTFKRLILCSVHRASTSLTYCASSQLLARTQRWAWRLKRKEYRSDQFETTIPEKKNPPIPFPSYPCILFKNWKFHIYREKNLK